MTPEQYRARVDELETQLLFVRTLTLEAAALIVEAHRRHEGHCWCDSCTQSRRDAAAIRKAKETR